MATVEELAARYGRPTEAAPASSVTPSVEELSTIYGRPKITVDPIPNTETNLPSPITPKELAESEAYQQSKKLLPTINRAYQHLTTQLPVDIGQNIIKHAVAAKDLASQGVTDITQGMPATGVGRIGMGILGGLVSPVTGAAEELIEKPVANLTGSKEIGEKAGLIGTLGLPIPKAAKTIANKLPARSAVNELVEKIGPENIQAVIAELNSNPRLSIMDVSEPVKQMAQKLVIEPGKNQNVMEKSLKERTAGRREAVEGAYNEALGAPVNVLDKLEELKATAKKTGSEIINPVVKSTDPVNLAPVIKHIDDISKPGVNSVISAGEALPSPPIIERLNQIKQYLTDNKSVRTDPKQLHDFQSQLRVEGEGLLNSPNPQDRMMGHQVLKLRNKLVDAIDNASPRARATPDEILELHGYSKPDLAVMDAAVKKKTADTYVANYGEVPSTRGTYREALAQYRDDKHVHAAFDKGRDILQNRRTVDEDRPEFWQRWIEEAKPLELKAVREGARVAIDNQIRSMQSAARKGEAIPSVEFNRKKLELLFGETEVNTMVKKLEHEKKIAQVNSDLFLNSQTAMRLKSDEAVNVRPKMTFGDAAKNLGPLAVAEAASFYLSGGLTSGLISAGALSKVAANRIGRTMDRAHNYELSKLVTATGEARQELINKLQNYVQPPKLSVGSKARLALPSSP